MSWKRKNITEVAPGVFECDECNGQSRDYWNDMAHMSWCPVIKKIKQRGPDRPGYDGGMG